MDWHGNLVTGAQLGYSGHPAGYGRDPIDVINYISAHDNQTLFDNNQYKLPIATSMTDRVRVNNLGLALVALAQGIPFFTPVTISSGPSLSTGTATTPVIGSIASTGPIKLTTFAVGLPPAWDNREDWAVMEPFLKSRSIKPRFDHIYSSHLYFEDLLQNSKILAALSIEVGSRS